jgi:hypothetical protein
MKLPRKYALLCSVSALLAACGGEHAADMQTTTVQAARVSAATASVSASDYYNVVQHIYVGYFGRPADAGGLAYFAGRLQAAGAPTGIAALSAAYGNPEIRDLIDTFGNSKESNDLYAGDNAVFMDAVYRNLFGRPADLAGLDYWVGLLNQGKVTRASAAVNIMAGAQGSDITVIGNKTAVAAAFTTALNTPQRVLAYDGLAANVVVRSLLGTVTAASNPGSFQGDIDSTLGSLVTTLGAQGMYAGKLTSSGYLFNALVLDDGQYWGFYSVQTANALYPTGFLQGKGTAGNGALSAPDVKDFGANPAIAGNVNATYVTQSKLDGTVGVPNGNIAFATTGLDDATYRYNTPAKLSELAGSPQVIGTLGTHAMTIADSGVFGAAAPGCNYSGTLTPRATGKNVFDVSWTFGAGTCPLSGQTATGVAFSYLLNDGATRQIVIAATNAGRTTGTLAQALVATPAGMPAALATTDTVVGTGAVAAAGNTLTVHYTGWLYSANAANQRSTKFDSSVDRGTPFQFQLGVGSVIKGWDQGMAGMRVGGKRILVIPASLGYGVTGSGNSSIPSNAGMVFEVELISVR